MSCKTVQVLGHEFDGCAGHVTVAGKGSGSNLRIATQRAIENMFRDPRLRHKQIGCFKLRVVVIGETTAPQVTLDAAECRRLDLMPKGRCRDAKADSATGVAP